MDFSTIDTTDSNIDSNITKFPDEFLDHLPQKKKSNKRWQVELQTPYRDYKLDSTDVKHCISVFFFSFLLPCITACVSIAVLLVLLAVLAAVSPFLLLAVSSFPMICLLLLLSDDHIKSYENVHQRSYQAVTHRRRRATR